MVKFFIYAYELIHIFIAIHVQALVSQKCFDFVTSGVGNLFTFFALYENMMFTLCIWGAAARLQAYITLDLWQHVMRLL